jgi:AGZA family xanthine/uracil permease-like MFS transporter
MLANGFIVTSLIWASGLAALIDHRLRRGAAFFAVAAGLTAFGIIHSPLPGGPLFFPWDAHLPAEARSATVQYVCGYAAVALLLLVWDVWRRRMGEGRSPKEMKKREKTED